MEIKIFRQLKEDTYKQIQQMLSTEEYELFYDLDEYIYDIYFIAYEEDSIVSVISLFYEESKVFVTAFTKKEYRKKGYFKALMESVCKNVKKLGITELYSQDEAAAKLGFEYAYSEYLMSFDKFYNQKLKGIKANSDKIYISEGRKRLGELSYYVGEHFVTIYDVEIYFKYRGQGFGKKLMQGAIDYIYTNLKKPVILHVSGENVTAFNLYKKLGFLVKEELQVRRRTI
ncbi:MAG: GNAT family N-acetyltransferase [Lachnospira sp.]|nr:GNAT family N-acetyltransferase [Lachnospira sp.]